MITMPSPGTPRYADARPYPPVQVSGPNPAYARAMLSNMGSGNSEMSAVSLYFYNSLVTGSSFEEVSQCFRQISMVEMHHLEIFGKLALQLGADPRLWSWQNRRRVYWSPGYNQYPRELKALLTNAIAGEKAAIQKYRCQAESIQDPGIVANLQRILLDEERHVELMTGLMEQYT